MPGRPVLRELAKRIAAEGGDHTVFDRIVEGETITAIAKSYDLSRRMIYDWIHQSTEREGAWAEAKRLSADALIEEGGEILDDTSAALTSSGATMAQARANWRKWLATTRDRKQYGEEKAPLISLNIGEAHLRALRLDGKTDQPAISPAPEVPASIPEAEYSIEETESVDADNSVLAELREA